MPSLPIARAEVTQICRKLGVSSHALRRTLAVIIRWQLSLGSFDSILDEAERLRAVNLIFFWAERSAQILSYSPDFTAYDPADLPNLISHIRVINNPEIRKFYLGQVDPEALERMKNDQEFEWGKALELHERSVPNIEETMEDEIDRELGESIFLGDASLEGTLEEDGEKPDEVEAESHVSVDTINEKEEQMGFQFDEARRQFAGSQSFSSIDDMMRRVAGLKTSDRAPRSSAALSKKDKEVVQAARTKFASAPERMRRAMGITYQTE
jgi:hypothetical protein